jgi:hypothetical protein
MLSIGERRRFTWEDLKIFKMLNVTQNPKLEPRKVYILLTHVQVFYMINLSLRIVSLKVGLEMELCERKVSSLDNI